MNKIYDELLDRIIDSVNVKTLKKSNDILSEIKGNVISIGTGGSFPITLFLEKVLVEKNNCFVKSMKARDLIYTNENPDYIVAFTYSGKTPSIVKGFNSKSSNKVIYTFDEISEEILISENNIISYKNKMEKEKSFISVSSTLIPLCLISKYYKDIDIEKIYYRCLNEIDNLNISFDNTVEIISGYDTYTSAYILESGLIESGLSYTVLHEANDYAHGRSSLNYFNNTSLYIFLVNGKMKEYELNLFEFIKEFNSNILILNSNYSGIIGELELTFKSYFLLKKMAEIKKINLSNIKCPKEINKLYKYKKL